MRCHTGTADTIVGGHLIPKDTLTLPQIYSFLKEDEVFDDPSEFKPERFLDKDRKTTDKAQMDRFVAFGMGKRQCVGEGLARVELFLVLGNLLLNYRFEPTEPIDLRPMIGAVLAPKPYSCRVVPL